jgi:hypothetical protein
MANTFVVSRSHLIYGVCLPLAVLLGYVLAAPQDSGSMAIVILVLCVLSVPLVMRWHQPLLVFSCNTWMAFYFLPGHPPVWMMLSFVSLCLSMANRSLGQHLQFFQARAVAYSLLFLGLVALGTAFLTGGVGFHFLGGSSFGGKKYIYFFAAIMLYFALATQSIPRNRANLFVGLFFLSTLLPLLSYLAAWMGPSFYFLSELFPMEVAVDNIEAASASGRDFVSPELTRLSELAEVAKGVLCYLLARHGARGMMDIRRPWRLGLFILAIGASLYSGFRSSLVLFPLIFTLMFYLEGLFRTRYVFVLIIGFILSACVVLPNVNRFPLSVQRALSFLPIGVDDVALADARGSTDWRWQMWKQLVPEVPKYLIKGKGYSINPDDLYLVNEAVQRGTATTYDQAMVAGDYHSGPFSVIIPFGLAGVFAFLWFLGATLYTLYCNWRYGDPALFHINALMLTYLIVQIFVFFFVFGSLYSDLLIFASIAGFSVSLNHGVARPRPEPLAGPAEEEVE